ncbi:MAG: hypothetical protein FWC41_09565 [Firmicutes bacterium]|nr:hypothetical protein [Bacillota bacterium]
MGYKEELIRLRGIKASCRRHMDTQEVRNNRDLMDTWYKTLLFTQLEIIEQLLGGLLTLEKGKD